MPENRLLGIAVALLTVAPVIAEPAMAGPAKQQEPGGAFAVILLVILGLCSFVALEMVLWILAPEPLAATGRAISEGRGRCLLVGTLLITGAALLVGLLSKTPGLGPALAPLILGVILLGLLIGLTATGALLGQGVMAMSGRSGQRVWELFFGSVLLGLSILFPVLGQVLGIYFALVGLGGVARALVSRRGPGK